MPHNFNAQSPFVVLVMIRPFGMNRNRLTLWKNWRARGSCVCISFVIKKWWRYSWDFLMRKLFCFTLWVLENENRITHINIALWKLEWYNSSPFNAFWITTNKCVIKYLKSKFNNQDEEEIWNRKKLKFDYANFLHPSNRIQKQL